MYGEEFCARNISDLAVAVAGCIGPVVVFVCLMARWHGGDYEIFCAFDGLFSDHAAGDDQLYVWRTLSELYLSASSEEAFVPICGDQEHVVCPSSPHLVSCMFP